MSNIPQKTLIPIYTGEINSVEQPLVDGRTLHAYLEIGKRFTDWIKQRIKEYGFTTNVDYKLTFHKMGKRLNVLKQEYELTLDMAKELAMVERNKKGREIRHYFIQCERQLRKVKEPISIGNTALQQGYTTLDDLFKIAMPLHKTQVEVTYTDEGHIINIAPLEQSLVSKISPKTSTSTKRIVWIQIVEAFFTEIADTNIPKKMCQNILISEELITLSTGEQERHTCLFFRATNLMELFRKTVHLRKILHDLSLHTTQALIELLQQADILAFNGKVFQSIPVNFPISDVYRIY
jgi:phage anti-repressor protein